MRDFHQPGRSDVFATGGMCATSHPLAAKVAVDLMSQGGNAVDAAIGAALVLGLAEPQATGIGGDCFALIRTPDGAKIGLNGSGQAPAAIDAEALRRVGDTIVPTSAHSVTIPGAIDGFCRLAADHGRLALADTLAPAIHYAETGIPVAPRVAFDWGHSHPTLQGAARRHYLIGDAAPTQGTLFRAPGQAEVLRRVAQMGRDGFYTGEVAKDMVDSLRDAGGVHTLEDFSATESVYMEPIAADYRGATLWELPPNAQGATALLLANILSQFDLSDMDPFGLERAHLETEAAKLAYDARNRFIADLDHVSHLDHMLSPDTAARLAALIRPDAVIADPFKATGPTHGDTVYISVVDEDRLAVSLIYSIRHEFGCGLASEKFGILFQNRGVDFSLIPDHPNEIAPRKRPLHTIIPAMVEFADGAVMPYGVMGGDYQPMGHLRVLSNMIDFGMGPQDAIGGARCFWNNGTLRVERGYSNAVHTGLRDLGHTLEVPDQPIGGGQAVVISADGSVLCGGSDPRKDGCALGY